MAFLRRLKSHVMEPCCICPFEIPSWGKSTPAFLQGNLPSPIPCNVGGIANSNACLAAGNGQEVGIGPSQDYQCPPLGFYIQTSGEETLSLTSEIIIIFKSFITYFIFF